MRSDWVMKFRPRFSVRTLAIFVTLVCAYFGAWEAADTYGIKRSKHPRGWDGDGIGNIKLPYFAGDVRAIMPLIVSAEELRFFEDPSHTKHYYLWLFGPTIKLPFEGPWQ